MSVPNLCGYKNPTLILLRTDVTETEVLFHRAADSGLTDHAKTHGCETAAVFFKMKYEAPDREFTGLRKLILAIAKKTGMRSSYRGVVGIDVSAWKGHESEEYFQILEKYLYDNGDEWQMVFVCSDYSHPEFARLMYSCANYFVLESRQLYVYQPDNLSCYLKKLFSDQGRSIEEEAVRRLAEALGNENLQGCRSQQLIRRAVWEVMRSKTPEEGNLITILDINHYLENPLCFLHILSRDKTEEEKNEHTKIIQL